MLRFVYDRVVAFHPYLTDQPWELGGVLMLHIDGDGEYARRIVAPAERDLIDEASLEGLGAHLDNHYGFTVVVDRPHGPTYYQLRFSDGSLHVWLMPGPPASMAKRLGTAATDFTPIPPKDALEARYFAENATRLEDPLRQAAWDEPITGLGTQVEVDAFQEARIDEMITRREEDTRTVPRRDRVCPCRNCRGVQ